MKRLQSGVGNCCPCCPCTIPVPMPMPMPMPIPAPQPPIIRYVQAPMASNPIRLPTAPITQCCELARVLGAVPLFITRFQFRPHFSISHYYYKINGSAVERGAGCRVQPIPGYWFVFSRVPVEPSKPYIPPVSTNWCPTWLKFVKHWLVHRLVTAYHFLCRIRLEMIFAILYPEKTDALHKRSSINLYSHVLLNQSLKIDRY